MNSTQHSDSRALTDDFFALVLSDLNRKGGTTAHQLTLLLDDWRSALTKMYGDVDIAIAALKQEEETGRLASLAKGRDGIADYLRDKEERDMERGSKMRFKSAIARRLSDVNALIKARNVTAAAGGNHNARLTSIEERLTSIEERLARIEEKLDRLLAAPPEAP